MRITILDHGNNCVGIIKKNEHQQTVRRTAVNELMLKLEPMNPSDAPARSAMLNGVWEFLYTGGLSPGTLAVQVRIRGIMFLLQQQVYEGYAGVISYLKPPCPGQVTIKKKVCTGVL